MIENCKLHEAEKKLKIQRIERNKEKINGGDSGLGIAYCIQFDNR